MKNCDTCKACTGESCPLWAKYGTGELVDVTVAYTPIKPYYPKPKADKTAKLPTVGNTISAKMSARARTNMHRYSAKDVAKL